MDLWTWAASLFPDPGTFIATLALVFTVGSFWHQNLRRGKLHVSVPRSGWIACPAISAMVLKLPFSFFNDGAIPIVVANLRLVLVGEQIKPLAFVATSKSIDTDEDRHLATQVAIPGRQAVLHVVEFQLNVGHFRLEAKDYTVELQGMIGNKREWKALARFPLHITPETASKAVMGYVTFDNDAQDVTKAA